MIERAIQKAGALAACESLIIGTDRERERALQLLASHEITDATQFRELLISLQADGMLSVPDRTRVSLTALGRKQVDAFRRGKLLHNCGCLPDGGEIAQAQKDAVLIAFATSNLADECSSGSLSRWDRAYRLFAGQLLSAGFNDLHQVHHVARQLQDEGFLSGVRAEAGNGPLVVRVTPLGLQRVKDIPA